jgi:hypothetical protein
MIFFKNPQIKKIIKFKAVKDICIIGIYDQFAVAISAIKNKKFLQ